MEKKIYTTPALSVEEFEMSEIVCASVTDVQGGDMKFGGGSTNPARSKGLDGIWDEE